MSLATYIAELKPEVGLIQEMKVLQGVDNQVDSSFIPTMSNCENWAIRLIRTTRTAIIYSRHV